MPREKHKRPEPRGESTEAEDWGGLPCSSVEVSVMGMERRGRVTRGGVEQVNGRPDEPVGVGGRRQPSIGGTSRMTRECQVRMCVQLRLACSAGVSPAGVAVRAP